MSPLRRNRFIIIFCTTSSYREARKIARALVKNKLAACVSIVSKVNSIYRWQGKIRSSREYLLVIKAVANHFSKIEIAIKRLHSYEVPEIIALQIKNGFPPYLDWLSKF